MDDARLNAGDCAGTFNAMSEVNGCGADIGALVDALRGRRVVIVAGAGCSTESGIPDYRGGSGRKRGRPPIQYQEFVRSPEGRARYWARSAVGWPRLAAAAPNEGHRALARLEAAGLACGLITQNVDGLHHAAGSRQVVELHGSLAFVRCLACGARSPRAELQRRLLADNAEWADALGLAREGGGLPADDGGGGRDLASTPGEADHGPAGKPGGPGGVRATASADDSRPLASAPDDAEGGHASASADSGRGLPNALDGGGGGRARPPDSDGRSLASAPDGAGRRRGSPPDSDGRNLASAPDGAGAGHSSSPDSNGRSLASAPDGDAELPAELVARFRVPDCAACGGILKPDVVLFGENVPAETVRQAWHTFDRGEVLLVVGSSLTVYSGRRFIYRAVQMDVPIAIVNEGPTRADDVACVKLEARLGHVLPRLADELIGISGKASAVALTG